MRNSDANYEPEPEPDNGAPDDKCAEPEPDHGYADHVGSDGRSDACADNLGPDDSGAGHGSPGHVRANQCGPNHGGTGHGGPCHSGSCHICTDYTRAISSSDIGTNYFGANRLLRIPGHRHDPSHVSHDAGCRRVR